jgi:putative acetyltransferase
MIKIAQRSDVDAIRQLFQETIESVNRNDYNPDQIKIWSAGAQRIENWQKKITEQYFLLSKDKNTVNGFASMDVNGYIDFMYIHKNYQNQGIATLLLQALESKASELHLEKMWANVSITARPFFQKRGFIITDIHIKWIQEVAFENAVMTKFS